jgi:hypothetical protein
LARRPDGCTEPLMMAHGFPIEVFGDLVMAGFASARFRTCAPYPPYVTSVIVEKHHVAATCGGNLIPPPNLPWK